MCKLVNTLGIHSLSKPQVSRMAELDEHIEQVQHRPPVTPIRCRSSPPRRTMKDRETGRVINAVAFDPSKSALMSRPKIEAP
jgi:hypothetical protein